MKNKTKNAGRLAALIGMSLDEFLAVPTDASLPNLPNARPAVTREHTSLARAWSLVDWLRDLAEAGKISDVTETTHKWVGGKSMAGVHINIAFKNAAGYTRGNVAVTLTTWHGAHDRGNLRIYIRGFSFTGSSRIDHADGGPAVSAMIRTLSY